MEVKVDDAQLSAPNAFELGATRCQNAFHLLRSEPLPVRSAAHHIPPHNLRRVASVTSAWPVPVEEIEMALERLRNEGDFDRIVGQ